MTVPPALSEPQELALDVILGRRPGRIGVFQINPMEWSAIDRLAGAPEGTYQRDPVPTYRKMLERSGCCLLDQWIPTNPLTMGSEGYEADTERGATTGAEEIVRDGIPIREPEDAVRHIEEVVLPRVHEAIEQFDEEATWRAIVEQERAQQEAVGPLILKASHAAVSFPGLDYGTYGYVNYFSAYALYPEVIEKLFRLRGDLSLLHNRAAARAYAEGALPPYCRLDHDMADSRGTLVDIRSLDRIWLPHFTRCIRPVVEAGVKLIWHCDGNLMQMVPRLLEAGLAGFQGFQYEEGMDYEKICRMRTRDGEELLIIGGVSVTRTLPFGTPDDVRREMKFLVEHGPRRGLFLAGSSSITPGVPWENLEALVEGFQYYRQHGRT